MATEIKSLVTDCTVVIRYYPESGVTLDLRTQRGRLIDVARADFLAAVEEECDVIIIDRAGLPEVERDGDGVITVAGRYRSVYREYNDTPADRAREAAREALALAEYLDALRFVALAEYRKAHPPVDEAQVEVLAAVVADIVRPGDKPGDGTLVTTNAESLARRLVERGVRVEVTP